MCKIDFNIYHKLYVEGKHCEDILPHLKSNLWMCVMFPTHTGSTWELQPKLSQCERRGGMYPAVRRT